MHNAIDSKSFLNKHSNKIFLRKKLHLPTEKFLIGLVARADPKKDHLNFISAAKLALNVNENFSFVLITNDILSINSIIKSFNLHDKFFVLPQQKNIEEIYHALDINTLSSAFGEGFPNVVAESMASGCPTVATDTGDSKIIIGNSQLIAPPKDPEALSALWLNISRLSNEEKSKIILECQNRIISEFSIEKMVSKMSNIYEEVLKEN